MVFLLTFLYFVFFSIFFLINHNLIVVLIFAILGINGALQRGNRRSLVGICDFLLVGFEFSRKISLNFQNGPQNQQLILRWKIPSYS